MSVDRIQQSPAISAPRLRRAIAALALLSGAWLCSCGKGSDDGSSPSGQSTLRAERFTTVEGFEVVAAITPGLLDSSIALAFDAAGRPMVSLEAGGIVRLADSDGDGIYDSAAPWCDEIKTAHGLYIANAAQAWVTAEGPEGAGLYRLSDENADGVAEKVERLAAFDQPMNDHGTHAIVPGFGRELYILFGNNAEPEVDVDPLSPIAKVREDVLLDRLIDPRGHSAKFTVPGGTIYRFDPARETWSRIAAGLRNPYDLIVDPAGEIFTIDSDMEQDVGLPWYRPVRAIHVVPGVDYGWRTGSAKFPETYLDTLPAMLDMDRGSPVGMVTYDHTAYPEAYRGAIFFGDWSRGRIRVMRIDHEGTGYSASVEPFVSGAPLNVTDLEVGPDGNLYFVTGGRATSGGLFRVVHNGGAQRRTGPPGEGIEAALAQPMQRSAWSRKKVLRIKSELGPQWESDLERIALDENESTERRLRTMGLLERHGPAIGPETLVALEGSADSEIQGVAARLLLRRGGPNAEQWLIEALDEGDAALARSALAGLLESWRAPSEEAGARLAPRLIEALNHSDRTVRFLSRRALGRIGFESWADGVLMIDAASNPAAAAQGVVALIDARPSPAMWLMIWERLGSFDLGSFDPAALSGQDRLDFLRALELALIRDRRAFEDRGDAINATGLKLLAAYPTGDSAANKEIEALLAATETPGAIEAMLVRLDDESLAQEDQIHIVYALRAIDGGWERGTLARLVAWFDRGWRMRGAISMEGYLYFLWQATLDKLAPGARRLAESRREELVAERARAAESFVTDYEPEWPQWRTDCAQMSFDELRIYLESDPMAYRGSPERGRHNFRRHKCAACHRFGDIGQGGGPDLTAITMRMSRTEILEALLRPSDVISDQYTAHIFELEGGRTEVGLISGEDRRRIALMTATGERVMIEKSEIEERRESEISIMPEGLVDTMQLHELTDLMAFLSESIEPQ